MTAVVQKTAPDSEIQPSIRWASAQVCGSDTVQGRRRPSYRFQDSFGQIHPQKTTRTVISSHAARFSCYNDSCRYLVSVIMIPAVIRRMRRMENTVTIL
nr:hypothetical protein [Faecalibaculum rodentium]